MERLVQNVLATNNVPFFDILMRDPRAWVEKYLRWQVVRPEFQALEKERLRLNNEPGPLDDLLQKLRVHYDTFQQKRRDFLSSHLSNYRSPAYDQNPFELQNFTGYQGQPTYFMLSISWHEIEAAVKAMPAGLSDKDRRKREEKLDRQIAELRAELNECEPAWRYVMSKSRVIADSWSVFVSHWEQLQNLNVEAIGPRGEPLGRNGEDEKWAHETLGLKPNPRGRFSAGGNQ